MISKELLSLVLGENVITGEYIATTHNCGESFSSIFTATIKIIGNELSYTVLQNGYQEKYLNLDTLGRLCKEWLIKDTNDIINTFNSSSVHGWVATSSIYNKRFIAKTELKAIIKATEYIAKEQGLI